MCGIKSRTRSDGVCTRSRSRPSVAGCRFGGPVVPGPQPPRLLQQRSQPQYQRTDHSILQTLPRVASPAAGHAAARSPLLKYLRSTATHPCSALPRPFACLATSTGRTPLPTRPWSLHATPAPSPPPPPPSPSLSRDSFAACAWDDYHSVGAYGGGGGAWECCSLWGDGCDAEEAMDEALLPGGQVEFPLYSIGVV